MCGSHRQDGIIRKPRVFGEKWKIRRFDGIGLIYGPDDVSSYCPEHVLLLNHDLNHYIELSLNFKEILRFFR